MHRLRSSGTSFMSSLAIPRFKKKALNSWAAVQDTYFSVKDIVERHRVVFTVGTSVASVATVWMGYTLRHYHETQIDRRLQSLERLMKDNSDPSVSESGSGSGSGSVSVPSCIATAGTTLIMGYGLGWRGGRWYAMRQIKREQRKSLGQMKPARRWQLPGVIKPLGWKLQFLRKPVTRTRIPENTLRGAAATPKTC